MLRNSHWCFITLKMKPKVLHWLQMARPAFTVPTSSPLIPCQFQPLWPPGCSSKHHLVPSSASWYLRLHPPGKHFSKHFTLLTLPLHPKLLHILPLQRSLLTQMLQETNHHPTPHTTLSSLNLSIYHAFLVAQLILNILGVFGNLQDFPSGK